MKKKYLWISVDNSKKASVLGEVPVGCVIVKDDVVVGNGYNTRESNNDLFGHAEIMAIKDACNN